MAAVFVALKDRDGNQVVVNLMAVTMAYQRESHVDLYFSNSNGISVQQSIEEIFEEKP